MINTSNSFETQNINLRMTYTSCQNSEEVQCEESMDVKGFIPNKTNLDQNNIFDNDEVLNNKIYKMIKSDCFEPGETTLSEKYVENLVEQNNEKTIIILSKILAEHFEDIHCVLGILNIVSHLDSSKIFPTAQYMAITATRHKNIEVQEYGIRCFENWNDKDTKKMLSSIKFEEQWLQEYFQSVIDDIEAGE